MGLAAAVIVVAAMLAERMVSPGATVMLAAVQAAASGVVLAAAMAGRRWVGVAVGAVLLAGVAIGSAASPWAAREAPAGLAHAMLYGAILVIFGRSLRAGRVSVVTRIAQRVNRGFRAGMVPYTRRVTWAWCWFAAGQLAASAALLGLGWWAAWSALVGWLHGVLAAALAVSEFVARGRCFPGEHSGFWETVRGVRNGSWGQEPGAGSAAKRDISA